MRGTHPEALCLLMTQVQPLYQDQPAYLSSISIQLPTVKAASAQY